MNTKKALEAAIVGGVLVVSMNAFAQTAACSGTAGSGTSITSGGFIVSGFTPKCSAKVNVSVLDSTTSFSVKSASTGGKTYFGGSTESGGVSSCGTFTGVPTVTASATGC